MATDRKQIRTIRRIYIALFGNFVMLYCLVSGWDVAALVVLVVTYTLFVWMLVKDK